MKKPQIPLPSGIQVEAIDHTAVSRFPWDDDIKKTAVLKYSVPVAAILSWEDFEELERLASIAREHMIFDDDPIDIDFEDTGGGI